jgi:hydroxymethylpyrimidine kinase/phosphomethylpyrimidine kinase
MNTKIKKILIIAGSDSIGGAGVQADIRTVNYFKCHATTAITAITAQDIYGVYDTYYLPEKIVRSQIEVILKHDISAIKIGMLGNKEIIQTVYDLLKDKKIPIILDPVFISTSGFMLIENDAFSIMKNKIIEIAYLITPNIKEAEILSGRKINNKEDMIDVGIFLLSMGAKNILIKGSHLNTDKIIVTDILITEKKEIFEFSHNRIQINTTHGTGCRLSSAIACLVGSGIELKESIKTSIDFISKEISYMKDLYR